MRGTACGGGAVGGGWRCIGPRLSVSLRRLLPLYRLSLGALVVMVFRSISQCCDQSAPCAIIKRDYLQIARKSALIFRIRLQSAPTIRVDCAGVHLDGIASIDARISRSSPVCAHIAIGIVAMALLPSNHAKRDGRRHNESNRKYRYCDGFSTMNSRLPPSLLKITMLD